MDISSNARFAQSIARPSSPVFEVPDETLFCSTCLKNQHLFSQSLASYFPPSDDPNYLEYEKAYPKFRRGLEERYPQVCQECEPRVQERIKATGYAAKTDHLRRMMERTRGHGLQYDEWNWKSVLIFLGGFGWISSLAGQVMWDGLAILTSGEEQDGLRDENFSVSGYSFLQLIMRDSGSTQDSAKLFDSVARVALLLGFLSSWWNPKLQERQRRKGGRLVGVQEFYKLQGLLLLVRCVAWAYIAGSELAVHTTQAAHLSMLVLGAIVGFLSLGKPCQC